MADRGRSLGVHDPLTGRVSRDRIQSESRCLHPSHVDHSMSCCRVHRCDHRYDPRPRRPPDPNCGHRCYPGGLRRPAVPVGRCGFDLHSRRCAPPIPNSGHRQWSHPAHHGTGHHETGHHPGGNDAENQSSEGKPSFAG